ncbi:MAG TPA: hypothetical protein VGM43_15095 [Bryobacteraceae bacterium]
MGIASFAGIQAYTGFSTGQAVGPTTIFSTPGAYTGLIKAGNYYIAGNSGTGAGDQAIIFLLPGATPTSPLTNAGSLNFAFPSIWEHSQMGIAARPTPGGEPGSYDVIFNVGSEYDHQLSTDPVPVSGVTTATLQGDSLYELTVNLGGSQPVVTGLKQIATGIRNVIGMGFQPGTGDFYFADNAIDGPGPTGDEPPQAEEINRIAAADVGVGPVVNFGYPTCYIQYRTGVQVGSGCVLPFFAIQPIPNGTELGSESEGVTQLAFAPANFPAGFNNGIFLGFDGKGGSTGPTNEENAVGYYDFPTGKYIHFSENSQNGVYEPIGILTTPTQLMISDFGAGIVYEVTGASTPPPPVVSTDSVSPQNGSGSGQVFTFQFTDSNGYGDLLSGRYHVLVNSAVSGAGSCWVLLQSTSVSLAPDDPNQTWSSVPYGSSMTAQNSQCAVSGVGTNISGSGNVLSLSLSLTFTAAYQGAKNVYTDVNASAPFYTAATSYTVTAGPPPPPTLSTDSVSPQDASGSSQVFTFQFSDSNGYNDLLNDRAHVLVNAAPNGTGSCWVLLETTGLRLAPDDPNQAWSFVPYGSSMTAQNSQCRVNGAGTTISGSGNGLTFNLSLTFTAAYSGRKSVYTDVNASGGYTAVTSYTVNATTTTDSVSPENGSGSSQVFTFRLSDNNGYADLLTGRYHVLVNSAVNGVSSCWVLLQSTGVSLAPNDPNQAWSFVPYGSPTTAQNSQCLVGGVGTSISGSGDSLTLNLSLTFTAAYGGTKNVYTDVNASAPLYTAVTTYTVQ